jgi:hypothetical protein
MMPENKDLLCRSMLMRKFRSNIRNDLFRAWDPRFLVEYIAKKELTLSITPADNLCFRTKIEAYDFMKGDAIEYCRRA